MGDYQEELARLQLADRKKLEKQDKKRAKELEGVGRGCGCFLIILSVIFLIMLIFFSK